MRTIIKLGLFVGAMLIATAAFGQGSIASTGGLGGDITPTGHSEVHMLSVHPTEFPLVDGQNSEGAPARQNYMPWKNAVALGLVRYHEEHDTESLGDVARRYRLAKVSQK